MSTATLPDRLETGAASAERTGAAAAVATPGPWERLWELDWARRLLLLALMGGAWELSARWLHKPLVLPTLAATLQALFQALLHGDLPARVLISLKLLLAGYALGVAAALAFTALAASTRLGADLLELLTAMMNPLPAIALLPLALLWLGLGDRSMLLVLVHAVLWPLALNAHAGFAGVSGTLRMVGRSYGLNGLALVFKILIPAAFPSILSGLKLGWAFAWRTLIAAELVFGVSSGSGGVGWFIYENKNQLEMPSVYAGLLTVVLIGVFVEHGLFHAVERATVRRWGMQR